MPVAPVRVWRGILASSVVATVLATAINLGFDAWYHKPYERAREQAQRSREGANLALDKAVTLHKRLGALFLQPIIPAIANDEQVRTQAQTILVLADALSDDCLKHPFISAPCRNYADWTKEAIPLLEKLSSPRAEALTILKSLPEAQKTALVQDLTTVVEDLRRIVEASFQ
jgi:hypothetical protein